MNNTAKNVITIPDKREATGIKSVGVKYLDAEGKPIEVVLEGKQVGYRWEDWGDNVSLTIWANKEGFKETHSVLNPKQASMTMLEKQ